MDTAAAKKQNTPKQPPAKNAKGAGSKNALVTETSEVTVKVKKKRGLLKFAIIFVLIALVGGFLFVSWHFNLFAARDLFFEAIYRFDPNYKQVEEIREDLYEWEKTVGEREYLLDRREEELDLRSDDLDLRERELEEWRLEREAEFDARIPIYRQPLNDDDLADMTALAKTFSSMDPAEAAAILAALYSVEDMTAILYYMSSKNSAAILTEMDLWIAASITDNLLRYNN